MECSIPLEEGMEKCPKCGWRIIDVHALLEVDPTSKLTRQRYELAHRIDTYFVIFVQLVLTFSLVGSFGLLSMNIAMRKASILSEEEPHLLSAFSYWFLGYAIFAVFALFAIHRISEVNSRFHEDRLERYDGKS
jgi:hypothetical protein